MEQWDNEEPQRVRQVRQHSGPLRNGEWVDWLMDAAALVALGFAVWVLYLVGWAW